MGGILDIFGASRTASAQRRAADQAARASQYATDQSTALQRQMFDQVRADTAGQRQLGNTATTQLQGLADDTTDPTEWIRNTPGYQANLDAGQRQINASAAARGGLLSGAAAREGLRYGQQYADRIYNQERNALLAYAGLGQTATGQSAQSGQAMANNTQNALMNNASNLATSYQSRADATAGLWGTISGTYGQGSQLARLASSFFGGMR